MSLGASISTLSVGLKIKYPQMASLMLACLSISICILPLLACYLPLRICVYLGSKRRRRYLFKPNERTLIFIWLLIGLVLFPVSSLTAFDVIPVSVSVLTQWTLSLLVLIHVSIKDLGNKEYKRNNPYDESSDDDDKEETNRHTLVDDSDAEYVGVDALSDFDPDEFPTITDTTPFGDGIGTDSDVILVYINEPEFMNEGFTSVNKNNSRGNRNSSVKGESPRQSIAQRRRNNRIIACIKGLILPLSGCLFYYFIHLLKWIGTKRIGRRIIRYVRDVCIGIKTHQYIFAWYLLASLFLSLFLSLMTCHSCLTMHPNGFSTGAIMYMYPRTIVSDSNSVCPWNTICHIYLTVPKDMSTSMIINFHTRSHKPIDAYVRLRALGNETEQESNITTIVNANWIYMNKIIFDERYQYWADLINLVPDSVYEAEVVVISSKDGNPLPWRSHSNTKVRFKTGPSIHSEREFVFASGGDMQWSRAGIALAKKIASESPLFVLIGGDIAYDNGMSGCYLRMDEWFYNYNRYMRTTGPDNYTIPILTAIGNHETGGFRRDRKDSFFYFNYFPHELNVSVQERRSYHEHLFSGHTYLVVLDSYVSVPIGGAQTQWLQDKLEAQETSEQYDRGGQRRPHKIVAYHASAYPIVRRELQHISKDIRDHWVPLFEEYAVTFVLEHHYHALQITVPIFNNSVDAYHGVTYMGSGAWGVPPRMDIDRDSWWVKKAASVDHVFINSCKQDHCISLPMFYDTTRDQVTLFDTLFF